MFTLVRTDSSNPHFIELVGLLDGELRIFDGDDHPFYDQFNKIDLIRHVLLAYSESEPVACGAFKEFDKATVEIKRMYVLPEFRGQELGGRILSGLEGWAAELGFSSSILETGKRQQAAIKLYQKMGYSIIPNFAQYAGVENSVCMEKKLSQLKP